MSRRTEQILLIVDSDPASLRLHSEAFTPAGFRVLQAGDEMQAMEHLGTHVCAAIVLDASQFPGDVEAFIKAAKKRDAGTVILSVSAESSMSGAVSAMRLGCSDVLSKPVAAARLRSAVKEALAAPISRPAVPEKERPQSKRMLGTSAAMRHVTALAERFAPSTAPVLITGESGTGKEVCAQFIHEHSDRAGGPFVALNCAALPKELSDRGGYRRLRWKPAQGRRHAAGLALDPLPQTGSLGRGRGDCRLARAEDRQRLRLATNSANFAFGRSSL